MPRNIETPEERDHRIATRKETDAEREARIANMADAARLPFQPDLARIEEVINERCPPSATDGDRVDFVVRRCSHYWRVQACMHRKRIAIEGGIDVILDQFDEWPDKYEALADELAKNYERASGRPWLQQ